MDELYDRAMGKIRDEMAASKGAVRMACLYDMEHPEEDD